MGQAWLALPTKQHAAVAADIVVIWRRHCGNSQQQVRQVTASHSRVPSWRFASALVAAHDAPKGASVGWLLLRVQAVQEAGLRGRPLNLPQAGYAQDAQLLEQLRCAAHGRPLTLLLLPWVQCVKRLAASRCVCSVASWRGTLG